MHLVEATTALPFSAQASREISALFGFTRAALTKRANKNVRAMRLQARRNAMRHLVSTIRALDKCLKDSSVLTEDFLKAMAAEVITLRRDLTIRFAVRNS